MMVAARWMLLLIVLLAGSGQLALAQAQNITIDDRSAHKTYTARDLLAAPSLRSITLPDPVYGRSMTYQAVPMVDLFKDLAVAPDDYVQATASDDFSVSIPGRLLLNTDASQPQALLAIEAPNQPWPIIPAKKTNAGTFYIVWRLAGRDKVSSEYWAYRTVSLKVTDSPFKRWPTLAVGDDVPVADPIRLGVDRFVAVCMACHRFGGAGEA